jgi:hypothetical protein
MAEARKAFRLATLEREEQELINDISDHENQLQTAFNDGKRKELQSALKIARVKLEITGYKIEYENATTVEEKSGLRDTIKTRGDTLNELLQQKHPRVSLFLIFSTSNSTKEQDTLFLNYLLSLFWRQSSSSSYTTFQETSTWSPSPSSSAVLLATSSKSLSNALPASQGRVGLESEFPPLYHNNLEDQELSQIRRRKLMTHKK